MPFLLLTSLLRGAAVFAFSGAAVIGSLGFLNKSKQPAQPKNKFGAFEVGKLAVYAVAVMLGYKLVKEVLK